MAKVDGKLDGGDVFEKESLADQAAAEDAQPLSPQQLPEGFDDLPIELLSFINRYKVARLPWWRTANEINKVP